MSDCKCPNCKVMGFLIEQEAKNVAYIQQLESKLSAARKCVEELRSYVSHMTECIRSRWQAGEPTADGGYRTMFAGKWYQSKPVNEEPKCDCGLDYLLFDYDRAMGGKTSGHS